MNGGKKFNWLGWLVLAILLSLWEYGARTSPTLQFYIPPVSQIFAALANCSYRGKSPVICCRPSAAFSKAT